VIIVACNAVAAATELAGLLSVPVVAANTDAYTLPEGTVIAARFGISQSGSPDAGAVRRLAAHPARSAAGP